jgi:hypothetical protein
MVHALVEAFRNQPLRPGLGGGVLHPSEVEQIVQEPAARLARRPLIFGDPYREGIRYLAVAWLVLLVPSLPFVSVFFLTGHTLPAGSPWDDLLVMSLFPIVGGSVLFALWLSLLFGPRGQIVALPEGVQFRHRGKVVFCPWALFGSGAGPARREGRSVVLPVSSAGVTGIELRRGETVLDHGSAIATSGFRFRSEREIELPDVYQFHREGVANLLLYVGCRLGAGTARSAAPLR